MRELVGRAAVRSAPAATRRAIRSIWPPASCLHKKPGDACRAGEPMLELRYNDESRLERGGARWRTQAVVIGDRRRRPTAPLVMGWVHDSGEQMFVADGSAGTE